MILGDGGSYCSTNIKGSGQVCIRNLWLQDGPLRNLGRTHGPLGPLSTFRKGKMEVWGWENTWSMDWLKGKFAGNQGFYHQIWGFPVKFPLDQSIDHGKSHK